MTCSAYWAQPDLVCGLREHDDQTRHVTVIHKGGARTRVRWREVPHRWMAGGIGRQGFICRWIGGAA